MLVLSRKVNERIVVPDCQLSVTVLGIDGNTVRLGVAAPAEIAVYREELWQRVCAESASQDPIATRAGAGRIPDRSSSPVAERS